MLCTQWNWPAWRPERPKPPTTSPSLRRRMRNRLFSPSMLNSYVWLASGQKFRSHTAPAPRVGLS